MATLVVGGDGNVDELGGGVGVAEGDDGDVDVGSLLDGLGVGARVGDDDQTGLLERTGDVVGEGTGGETTGDGLGAGVGGELEDGTLTVGTGRDDTDVRGVVDGGDDTGSQDDLLPVCNRLFSKPPILIFFSSSFEIDRGGQPRPIVVGSNLPGLADVDDVDTISTVEAPLAIEAVAGACENTMSRVSIPSLPQVRVHVNLQVLGAEVGLGSQEQLNVLAGGVENAGQVSGRHDCGGCDGEVVVAKFGNAVVLEERG